MRIYIVLAIITFTNAQADLLNMPTGLTQDFGDADQHLDDLNKKINNQQDKDYEEEKRRKIEKFLEDTEEKLEEYMDVDNKTLHQIGKFNVQFQKKCQIDLPELELPEEPHEIDCFSGGYDGKYMAEAITKITKDNLQNPKQAMAVLYECELLMKKELTLTLYEHCFEGEFGQYYTEYFNEFVREMEAKNFKYNAETKKFVYQSDTVVVDRETGETELIPTNQISL